MYELVTPISTDAEGNHVSNVVSISHKRRLKRDTTHSRQPLYFNVTVFGREFHLKLKPNTRLIAPGAVVEWHDDDPTNTEHRSHVGNTTHTANNTEEIWKKEPLWTNCAYIGEIKDIPGASVALSNCDGLVRLVFLFFSSLFNFIVCCFMQDAIYRDVNRYNKTIYLFMLIYVFICSNCFL